EVKSIVISRFENGKPNGLTGWQTDPGRYWVLGVEANGKALNTTKVATLGKLSGEVKFDFFGSESGAEVYKLADPGTEYQLDIKILNGDKEELVSQKLKI